MYTDMRKQLFHAKILAKSSNFVFKNNRPRFDITLDGLAWFHAHIYLTGHHFTLCRPTDGSRTEQVIARLARK